MRSARQTRLTTRDVAALLGVCVSAVSDKARRGTLPYVGFTPRGGYLFLLADVARYKARRQRVTGR
jgi:Helix-turn-helix domain